MKFKLVLEGETEETSPTKVHFKLRKNHDGSVTLVINNEAVGDPADLLTIGTDGVIRVRGYYQLTTSNAFLKYDEEKNSTGRIHPRIVKI